MFEKSCQVCNSVQPLSRARNVCNARQYLAPGRITVFKHGRRRKETAALHVHLPALNRHRLRPRNPSLPQLPPRRIAAPQLRTALNKPIEVNQAISRGNRTHWNKCNSIGPKTAAQCSLDKL